MNAAVFNTIIPKYSRNTLMMDLLLKYPGDVVNYIIAFQNS